MPRTVAAASLLLGFEVVGLTMRFDSGASKVGVLEALVGSSRIVLQVFVAAAAVALLLAAHFRGLLTHQDPTVSSPRPHRSWAYLLAHLAAFGCFTWLTWIVLEGGEKPLPLALVLATAWGAMGLTTVLIWIAIWLPPNRWEGLARGGLGLMLGAAAAGLAAWGAGKITVRFWEPLSRSTLIAVEWVLRLLCSDTVVDQESFLVGTSSYHVTIGPGCSGFEGIGLILVLICSFLWIVRGELRFPRALVLLPLGCAIIWAVNALRIVSLIALGTWGFRHAAIGGFHSVAGWIAFTAISLGLISAARSWRFITHETVGVRDGEPSPSSPYLVPLIALVGATMVTQAFADDFDRLYPLRVIVVGLFLWFYRQCYSDLRMRVSWEAVGLGIVAFLIWISLEWASTPTASLVHDLGIGQRLPQGFPMIPWLGFRIVGSVLIVPLVEELAFRGYLTRRLVTPEYWSLPVGFFSWPSFLVSSAIFGMLHTRWVVGTISGMIFALALYRRRELTDAVVAHATTNALIALFVLGTGNWSLWD